MLKINLKPETKNLILEIIRDLFFGGLALLVIFSLMEIVKPRIVLNYINLDIFLLVVIILGVITAIIYEPKAREARQLEALGNFTVILVSILIGLACIYFAKGLGYISILVGIATAIISYFLIILCLEE